MAPIFDPARPDDFNIDDLFDLTTRTANIYSVHMMNKEWGDRSIMSQDQIPDTRGTIARIVFFRDPDCAPQDGDILITRTGAVRFIFDVVRYPNPSDLWEAKAVANKPAIGLGHKPTTEEIVLADTLGVTRRNREAPSFPPHTPQ